MNSSGSGSMRNRLDKLPSWSLLYRGTNQSYEYLLSKWVSNRLPSVKTMASAEADEDAPVNPTYIDDDFDNEFDDY